MAASYWMARSLGVATALVVVAGLLAYAFDLVFVPPSDSASSWQAPHWQIYKSLWEFAEYLGRLGLRQGIFPSVIRQFDDQGLPAYLPWIAIGLVLGVLSLLSLLFLVFSSAKPSETSVPPHLEPTANSPMPRPPSSILSDPVIVAEPLIQAAASHHPQAESSSQPYLETVQKTSAVRVQPSDSALRMESNLYESEQALETAIACLEEMRRASLNLVLDPAVAKANQDLRSIHQALDELEISIEQLRGHQHALMADLVKLHGQPANP